MLIFYVKKNSNFFGVTQIEQKEAYCEIFYLVCLIDWSKI